MIQARRAAAGALRVCEKTWLAQAREADPDRDPIPRFVERDLRKYLEWEILALGLPEQAIKEIMPAPYP